MEAISKATPLVTTTGLMVTKVSSQMVLVEDPQDLTVSRTRREVAPVVLVDFSEVAETIEEQEVSPHT